MKAKTIKGSNAGELSAKLDRCTADGFAPTVALVFLSVKQDRNALCEVLNRKGLAIFGATTAGEFIDGDIGEGSIAVMLLELSPALFQIQLEEIGEDNLEALAKKIGSDGKQTFANPAFLVSYSGLYTDGEAVLKGIEEAAGENVVIFGGQAGDELMFKDTFVFTNNKASTKAILYLVINNDRITMEGHATGGWKPVGTERTITRSQGKVVSTIDDEPALDVVMKYLGISPEKPNEVNDALMQMGSYFPILLHRAEGDLVTRTSMFANVEERSLTFSGNVPQGSKFRFALPPDFEVVDEVVAKSNELKEKHFPQADALIMFSCVARHVTLGPMVSEEIEGVKKVWDSPLVGFFSYGEIGKSANGKHEFYNNTCCLVALKEKEPGVR